MSTRSTCSSESIDLAHEERIPLVGGEHARQAAPSGRSSSVGSTTRGRRFARELELRLAMGDRVNGIGSTRSASRLPSPRGWSARGSWARASLGAVEAEEARRPSGLWDEDRRELRSDRARGRRAASSRRRGRQGAELSVEEAAELALPSRDA